MKLRIAHVGALAAATLALGAAAVIRTCLALERAPAWTRVEALRDCDQLDVVADDGGWASCRHRLRFVSWRDGRALDGPPNEGPPAAIVRRGDVWAVATHDAGDDRRLWLTIVDDGVLRTVPTQAYFVYGMAWRGDRLELVTDDGAPMASSTAVVRTFDVGGVQRAVTPTEPPPPGSADEPLVSPVAAWPEGDGWAVTYLRRSRVAADHHATVIDVTAAGVRETAFPNTDVSLGTVAIAGAGRCGLGLADRFVRDGETWRRVDLRPAYCVVVGDTTSVVDVAPAGDASGCARYGSPVDVDVCPEGISSADHRAVITPYNAAGLRVVRASDRVTLVAGRHLSRWDASLRRADAPSTTERLAAALRAAGAAGRVAFFLALLVPLLALVAAAVVGRRQRGLARLLSPAGASTWLLAIVVTIAATGLAGDVLSRL